MYYMNKLHLICVSWVKYIYHMNQILHVHEKGIKYTTFDNVMHNSYNVLHLLCITFVMLQLYYICNCKKLTLEPAIRAIPTESFRFIPPDSVLLWAFLLLTRLMDNSMSSTSCFTLSEGQPFNWTKNGNHENVYLGTLHFVVVTWSCISYVTFQSRTSYNFLKYVLKGVDWNSCNPNKI